MQGNSQLIRNARVLTPDELFEIGWLLIEDGKIAALGHGEPPASLRSMTLDARGQWLVPGFIDLHVHGADGAEVMDGTLGALQAIGRFHAQHGTTGWLPTTLTASVSELETSLKAAHVLRTDESQLDGAAVLGVHLEGPFISPHRVGAQNPDHVLPPTVDVMKHLLDVAPGTVKKVTLAPDQPGALEVIAWLQSQGVIASIGHTDGTFAETMRGIEAGATHATHLFNAMRGLHHRDGGVVGACLLSEKVICELIADGHHVDVEVMKLAVRIKGKEGIALITDAISATGKPNGCYRLGGLDIVVTDGKSLLSDGHTIAGSTLTMGQAVRNMVQLVGVSLLDAIEMASTTPARELGLAHQKGRIAVGYDADVVLLDEQLQVTRTLVHGREVFCR